MIGRALVWATFLGAVMAALFFVADLAVQPAPAASTTGEDLEEWRKPRYTAHWSLSHLTPAGPACVLIHDRRGPYPSKAECRKRLDDVGRALATKLAGQLASVVGFCRAREPPGRES